MTGRKILRAAEGNLKKVTLELGGKSPCIVFGDADPVAEGALLSYPLTLAAPSATSPEEIRESTGVTEKINMADGAACDVPPPR